MDSPAFLEYLIEDQTEINSQATGEHSQTKTEVKMSDNNGASIQLYGGQVLIISINLHCNNIFARR